MSQYPTADEAAAWLKQQQHPHAATGTTVQLKRPRTLRTIPVRRLAPTPVARPSLLPLLVWIGIVGMLGGMAASQYPVLALGWIGLVVAIVWKLER